MSPRWRSAKMCIRDSLMYPIFHHHILVSSLLIVISVRAFLAKPVSLMETTPHRLPKAILIWSIVCTIRIVSTPVSYTHLPPQKTFVNPGSYPASDYLSLLYHDFKQRPYPESGISDIRQLPEKNASFYCFCLTPNCRAMWTGFWSLQNHRYLPLCRYDYSDGGRSLEFIPSPKQKTGEINSPCSIQ